MKCFIASAFGRDDVDAVYDRCVRPVLKSLSVQPLRVDRVEHNDDVDDKIFSLLDQADFAIADLTYARPSVYYEAGHAAGSGKPVIFIARNDHFKARDDDPDGLLRVHFDLQMKNIIPWTHPNDAFSKRLAKRLRYVIKPLLLIREEEDRRRGERLEFQRLALNAKIESLSRDAAALLKSHSFALQAPQSGTGLQRGAPLAANVLAAKASSKKRQEVLVICTPSAVKRLFASIELRGELGIDFSKHGLPMMVHYVVVSLRPVPLDRVTTALPSFEFLSDGKFYRHYSRSDGYSVEVIVHVIGGVKSEKEFSDAFRRIID